MPARKIVIVFTLAVLLAGGVFVLFYYNPKARESREGVEKVRQMMENMESLEREMAADIYGGQTPEETLELFVAALREEDIEKAAKFFMPEEDPDNPGHLSWEKFERELNRIKEDRELGKFADEISKHDKRADYSSIGSWLVYKTSDGTVKSELHLLLNTYADIWKIDDIF